VRVLSATGKKAADALLDERKSAGSKIV